MIDGSGCIFVNNKLVYLKFITNTITKIESFLLFLHAYLPGCFLRMYPQLTKLIKFSLSEFTFTLCQTLPGM